jgi:sulfite dehydrogenase
MNKIIFLLSAFALTQALQAKTIELPSDTVLWRTSDLPGYELTLQKCSACHSAHYAEYQPPNTGVGYWNAQVLRMKNIFKAPVADEEVPVIVDYLNKTYGVNRK